MRKKRFGGSGVLLFVGLFAALATAQEPSAGNVYFGYTYYNTNLSLNRGNLNGWEGSLEGRVFPFLGIVADLTGHYGSLDFPNPAGTCAIGATCPPISASSHVYEAMFGPRFSVPLGRLRPFGEFELGVGHVATRGFGTNTSAAVARSGLLTSHRLYFASV